MRPYVPDEFRSDLLFTLEIFEESSQREYYDILRAWLTRGFLQHVVIRHDLTRHDDVSDVIGAIEDLLHEEHFEISLHAGVKVSEVLGVITNIHVGDLDDSSVVNLRVSRQ